MFNGNVKVNDENGNNLQKEDQVTRMNEHFCSVLNREDLKTHLHTHSNKRKQEKMPVYGKRVSF